MKNPMWFVEEKVDKVKNGQRALGRELVRSARSLSDNVGLDATFAAYSGSRSTAPSSPPRVPRCHGALPDWRADRAGSVRDTRACTCRCDHRRNA
jgi:hypothetical protein